MIRRAVFSVLILVVAVMVARDASAEAGIQDNKIAVGVLAVALNAYSIDPRERAVQQLLGTLQWKFKSADMMVVNAELPSGMVPDWQRGAFAVDQAITTLDNPMLDVLILVDARFKTHGLEVVLRMVDTKTREVIYEETGITDMIAGRDLGQQLRTAGLNAGNLAVAALEGQYGRSRTELLIGQLQGQDDRASGLSSGGLIRSASSRLLASAVATM